MTGVLAFAATSCAQKGFPPGGPEDRSPPFLFSSSPDSGSTGVEADASVTLAFNENMNRRSVEGSFYLVPPTDLESLRWKGAALTLVTAKGLVPDTTYTILLGAGMRDRRGNRMAEPAVIHFSTGDSLAPGRVEGEVITGRLKPQGVMVWAFGSAECPPELGQTTPAGLGQADARGKFFIAGLAAGRSYCVYAHHDVDGNGRVDEGDLFIEADSLAAITADSLRVSGLEIYLVADDEPGKITGAVVDSALILAGPNRARLDLGAMTSDSTGVAMSAGGDIGEGSRRVAGADSERVIRSEGPVSPDSIGVGPDTLAVPPDSAFVAPDSAAIAAARAESIYLAAPIVVVAVDQGDSTNFIQGMADAKGAFTLSNVKPGVYRLEAFRDLDANRAATPGIEPATAVEGVVVRAGRTTEVATLVLRQPSPAGED